MSLTVTRLARSCNLARSTVLYYESIGLLTRPRRSAGNYRVYSEKDLDRLRQICTYRDAGLALADIRSILDASGGNAAAVLRRRLTELSEGIERMREHQRAIARLLQTTPSIQETTRGNQREIHRRFTRFRLHRRGYAPTAHRVRKQRTQRTPGIPGVPAHSRRKRSARSANRAVRRVSRPPPPAKATPEHRPPFPRTQTACRSFPGSVWRRCVRARYGR